MRYGKLNRRIIFILTFLIPLFCVSCNGTISLQNPCVITDACVYIGEKTNQHKFAGAYIDAVNCSDKTIQSAELCFFLYDSKGKPISYTGNKISVQVDLNLFPSETTEIIVSLDKVLGTNLDSSYNLDFVHFTRVNFEDGTYWVDPLGVTTKW